MLQIYPTTNGTGVSIFGDYGDLKSLYDTVSDIAGSLDEDNKHQKGQHQLLMNFAYEIRMGFSGQRLEKEIEFPGDSRKYSHRGFQLVWTDILFFLSALRANAGYTRTSKLHQATLYLLEHCIETALFDYDEMGAPHISEYIAHRINIFNPYVLVLYQAIHIKFVSDKPGKIRFRKIPELLGTLLSEWTPEYQELMKSLEESARHQKCDVADLEFSEFPQIKW